MPEYELVVKPDPAGVAAHAADLIAGIAAFAVRDRRVFSVALAGGSTPEAAYQAVEGVDWSKALVFFGDERLVPPDDPRSNYGMAKRTLLDRERVPANRVFRVPTESATPAQDYAATLAKAFRVPPDGPPPVFDLILLGLGDDGHTASLFPGFPALEETAWVTTTPPGVLPPAVDRVTLTLPVLNAARHVAFLVTGAKKGEKLKEVLAGVPYPAALVKPSHGIITWVVDAAAAGGLQSGA